MIEKKEEKKTPLNIQKHVITQSVNNKLINKINETANSLMSSIKKKSTPVNESISSSSNNPHTPKTNPYSINKHQYKEKVSSTTPVTNKNSRKNSIEKNKHNVVNHYAEKSNPPSLSKPTPTPNNNQGKTQPRLNTAAQSTYMSNNSSSSNINNKYINLSKPKSTEISNTTNSNKDHQTNYEEINLITDNNTKKSQKIIQVTNPAKNPNTNINSLANSQNFSNNLKIFDIAQKHLGISSANANSIANSNANVNINNINKKKTNVPVSMPITNQTSKQGSKNNSKSASRVDEKTESMRKKLIDNEVKKMNINNPPGKKHATSTNSPTHFPLHFNKENINKQIKSNLASENVVLKYNKDSSVNTSKHKEDLSKTKPIVSLKLNLNNSNLKSSEVSKKDIRDKKIIKKEDDGSIETILDNSEASIKSTVRENNYYKKEADRISSFIKTCNDIIF